MKQYLDILRDILETGEEKRDRTGVGTISKFGVQARYNLQDGFPLVTTKRTWFKGIVYELLWMLKGDTNIKYLVDNGIHIWDDWADENGELGPIYGKQWRAWSVDPWSNATTSIDQIAQVIENIKSNPDSRRHIVSAWNVEKVPDMKLPPCHLLFQFYVNNGKLSCQMYQRSCDFILGCPFNVASYSLLTHMVAQVCDLKVGDFIHVIGDCHVYLNHLSQANEQLNRDPYELPQLWLNPAIKDIDKFKFDDIKILNYKHHSAIKAPIAV